jgi:hypothetical protein
MTNKRGLHSVCDNCVYENGIANIVNNILNINQLHCIVIHYHYK